jgi:hypothetical protein
MVVQLNSRMKRLLILAAGILLSFTSHAAQTAQARMYCLSLRFQQGADQIGSTLDLTTIAPSINGELAPTFDTPTLSYSIFALESLFFDEPVWGDIVVNLPLGADVNQNGFWDFFETSQSVSGTTTGGYSIQGVDEGNVSARWNRGAGSKDGSCILTLTSTTGFGKLGDYAHSFELIEYTGPLNYLPDTNRVTGTVNLTQTGDPSSQLSGPIEFIKSPISRFDELGLQPGVLTNASALVLNYSNDIDSFLRDLSLKTNYYGAVDFEDGDPNTFDQDYYTWFLSIDDSNDSNGNGIPDFSDDPSPTEEPLTVLSLVPTSTNLSLSISGAVGHIQEVQRTSSLSQTDWTNVLSFTLTNSSQTISLPLPAEATSFWRIHVL